MMMVPILSRRFCVLSSLHAKQQLLSAGQTNLRFLSQQLPQSQQKQVLTENSNKNSNNSSTTKLTGASRSAMLHHTISQQQQLQLSHHRPSASNVSSSSFSTTAASTTTNETTTTNKPIAPVSSNLLLEKESVSSEVNKFSAMDEEWWNPQKNPLISMNVVRVGYIQDMVQQHLRSVRENQQSSVSSDKEQHQNQRLYLDGLTALDVGCGGGLLSESLARLGANVTGLDPSERLIAAARAHHAATSSTTSINYVAGTTLQEWVQQQPPQKQQFDVICLLEVIEHVPNPESLLQTAIQHLLKPDGLLFVSTMNRTIKSHLMTIVGAEYIMGILPVGTHDWNKYLSPQEVANMMTTTTSGDDTGMEPLNVTGMVLNPPSSPFRAFSVLSGKASFDWKLDPKDTDVNWIGVYRRKTKTKQ